MAKEISYPATAEISARPWAAFSTLVGWLLPYFYWDHVPSVLYWEQTYWYCCTGKNKRNCRHCNSFETVQTRDPEINGQSCKGSSFTTLFVRGSGRDQLITLLKKIIFGGYYVTYNNIWPSSSNRPRTLVKVIFWEARWVIERTFFHSLDTKFRACLWDSPPDMLRPPHNLMLKRVLKASFEHVKNKTWQ